MIAVKSWRQKVSGKCCAMEYVMRVQSAFTSWDSGLVESSKADFIHPAGNLCEPQVSKFDPSDQRQWGSRSQAKTSGDEGVTRGSK